MDGVLVNPLVLILVVSVFALVIALTVTAVRYAQAPARRMDFQEALDFIASSEMDEIDTALNPTEKKRRSWYEYWYDLTVNTGKVVEDPSLPGRIAASVGIVAAIVAAILLAAPIGAALGAAVGVVLYRALLVTEAKKRRRTMDKQIPLLLSSLKASLHAGSTPQRAMEDIADDMPSPLGDEIRIVKRDIELGKTLEEALTLLGQRVPSREMQFLVSSVNIAVASGSDLAPQIDIIYGTVVQRTRLAAKIRTAIAQVQPTAGLAYCAVPGMMIISMREGSNRAFWFGDGLIFFILVWVLYAAGYFAIKALVKNTENA